MHPVKNAVIVFRGHIVACELWLKGLRNLKMTEMELVRNDDLTFSALKLLVELPWVELAGKFRLYDKYKDFNIGFCFCNNGVYCLIDSGTMFMCSAFSPRRTAREQSMPRSLVSRYSGR